MDKDVLNISINGDEKSKKEIVYNNVIETMEKLKMSKQEQIDYLKNKIITLENDYQNNVMILITIILAIFLLAIGIYLLITDDYILGIVFIALAFIIIIYKLIKTLVQNRKIKNKKFMELESVRNSLNAILK